MNLVIPNGLINLEGTEKKLSVTVGKAGIGRDMAGKQNCQLRLFIDVWVTILLEEGKGKYKPTLPDFTLG